MAEPVLMRKFSGDWDESKIKDLLLTHKNKSHAETAVALTQKWGVVVSRDSVKNKYNSISMFGIKDGKEKNSIEPLKNREYFNRIGSDEDKKGKRTYFVTSAVAGGELAKDFFNSIENFCRERKAKLIVFPMRSAQSKNEEYTEDVIEQLEDSFYTEYTFNSNLAGFDLEMSPTAISPLAGIQRISDKSSIIVSSSKQDLETIPVATVGLPHILASTGTITLPNYGSSKISILAEEDNVIGGLVVEIEDQKIFHVRQVQSGENGSFYDLDKKYSPKGVTNARAEVFVLGDIHAGSEDKSAIKAFKEAITITKPKIVVFHDFFDGGSVNHHQKNDMYAKITRPPVYQTLQNELNNLVTTIESWSKEFPDVTFYVARSNHDDFLNKYINSGDFAFDSVNYRVSLDLAIYIADGFNPLEKYVETKLGKVKNFKWLRRDEEVKIAGCVISAHGDKGSNGSRGSLVSTEKALMNSITGHTHSPRCIRSSWQVGTCTRFDLPYTVGAASNWLHASCLLYENSQKQMIISVDGHWRA